MNTDVALPSGAKLHISLSPFAVSKALYQAVLEEAKLLKLDTDADVDINLFKDLFCSGFSSKKIEVCLEACMRKATYNGIRITADTFEPEEARQDYMQVCWEVAYANLLPFTKSLSQLYSGTLAKVQELQKSKSPTKAN